MVKGREGRTPEIDSGTYREDFIIDVKNWKIEVQ